MFFRHTRVGLKSRPQSSISGWETSESGGRQGSSQVSSPTEGASYRPHQNPPQIDMRQPQGNLAKISVLNPGKHACPSRLVLTRHSGGCRLHFTKVAGESGQTESLSGTGERRLNSPWQKPRRRVRSAASADGEAGRRLRCDPSERSRNEASGPAPPEPVGRPDDHSSLGGGFLANGFSPNSRRMFSCGMRSPRASEARARSSAEAVDP